MARLLRGLMVGGSRAYGIEVHRVLFERTSAYRDRQGQEWGVPAGEFSKKAAGR